ncbi:MAG: flagellar protein FlgN [Candidatus Brocadiaceae bacterium]|jgi:flagellar biosynthesis/type III secretory pathway chaperone
MRQVEQLLPLLDEQVDLLRQKLSLMKQIGRCVREGELEALRGLVEKEAALGSAESDLQQRTERIRAELAEASGRAPEAVTLGTLVEEMHGPLAIALSDRRERLVVLVGELREEATTTALLVRQAVELNEQLLALLTGRERPSETYSADGALSRSESAGTFHQSV